MLCFISGIYMANPHRQPVPVAQSSSTTTSSTSEYAAPSKPLPSRSLKTPEARDPMDDEPAATPGVGGGPVSSLWVGRDATPLYAGQGLNQPTLQKMPFATRLEVLKQVDDWVQVRIPGGSIGWTKRNSLSDTAPPGAAGVGPGDAVKVLQSYFNALNAHNLEGAYDLLSFEFKRDLAYRTFQAGYAGLESVAMRVVRVQTLSPTSSAFYVEMLCTERPQPKAFSGEYILALEQGQWRIAQATLQPVDPAGLAAFPTAASPLPATPAFADPVDEDETPDVPPL